MRIDDATSSSRRLSDAQRRQLKRLIAREDVDGLVELIHAANVPSHYVEVSEAYLSLRLVQLNDPNTSLSEALDILRQLAACKDWGTYEPPRREYRPLDLDEFDESTNGDSNGHHEL